MLVASSDRLNFLQYMYIIYSFISVLFGADPVNKYQIYGTKRFHTIPSYVRWKHKNTSSIGAMFANKKKKENTKSIRKKKERNTTSIGFLMRI